MLSSCGADMRARVRIFAHASRTNTFSTEALRDCVRVLVLPLDELRRALDQLVAQVDLALANAVRVRDIPRAARRCGIHATRATRLQAHLPEEFLEVCAGGHLRKVNHRPGAAH